MKSILIFGDSIVWGAVDKDKGGWVERLKIDLAEQEIDVYNLGIAGDTSADVLDRLEEEIKSRLYDETTILCSIGINDTLYPEKITYFEENIRELIRICQKFTPAIMFLGLTNVDEKVILNVLDEQYNNNIIAKFDKILKAVCEENQVRYQKMFGFLGDKDFEDGLHPNSDGHEKIYKQIKGYLEEWKTKKENKKS